MLTLYNYKCFIPCSANRPHPKAGTNNVVLPCVGYCKSVEQVSFPSPKQLRCRDDDSRVQARLGPNRINTGINPCHYYISPAIKAGIAQPVQHLRWSLRRERGLGDHGVVLYARDIAQRTPLTQFDYRGRNYITALSVNGITVCN